MSCQYGQGIIRERAPHEISAAYQEGKESWGDPHAVNPFEHEALREAWEDGRGDALEAALEDTAEGDGGE